MYGQPVGVPAPAVPVESPVTSAVGRVEELTRRAEEMAIRVSAIADGLFGQEPPAVQPAGSPSPRMGEFGRLHDRLDALSDAVCAVEQATARFSVLSSGA